MIEYSDGMFPALLDQLDHELPLTHRRLRLFSWLESTTTVLVRVCDGDVELWLNARLINLYSASAYAALAYSVALALDDAKLVRLPLRRYDVEREYARICDALREPAPWLGTLDLSALLLAYCGDVIGAIELPAKMARPDQFNARPEPMPGETEAQGMLRAVLGFDFGKGYGRAEPGSA